MGVDHRASTYLTAGGNVAGDANVDGESGLKWTSSCVGIVFIDVICFEIKYP